jgi:hypothetical protein
MIFLIKKYSNIIQIEFSKLFIIPTLLFLFANTATAQHEFPVAISKTGILLGKYHIANDATNPLPDTISLEDAKNIFTINDIYIDREQKLTRIKISGYQMTIIEDGMTTTIIGNGEELSVEMKDRLHRIKSGAKLLFEGIKAIWPNGIDSSVIILSFTVI